MPEAPFAGMGLLACDRHLKSFETLFQDGLACRNSGRETDLRVLRGR